MEEYTKYEKARIIGARALQLSMGAPMIVKLEIEDLEKLRYSTIEIAKLEFDKGLIPITVKRILPEKIDMPEQPKKVAAKIDLSVDGLDEAETEKDEFDEVDSGAGDDDEV